MDASNIFDILNKPEEKYINIENLDKILEIEPNMIIYYYKYKIHFLRKYKEDDNEVHYERENLIKEFRTSNICGNDFIPITHVLKKNTYIIIIKDKDAIVAIIAADDFYPENAFEIVLLCSSNALNMSFGLYLQYILMSYIYYKYEEGTDDSIFIYLKSIASAYDYYKKIGYKDGSDCHISEEYKYEDEEHLYPLKICNIRKVLVFLHEKLIKKLYNTWIKFL